MRVASRFGWIALLALSLTDLAAAKARADLIFLQDGYVLQGKVRREFTAELDSVTKEMQIFPKGFFLLDDGPRRIYFSQKQVRIVEKLDAPADERVVSRKGSYIMVTQPMPAILEVLEVGPWNLQTWRREYHFRAPGGRDNVGVVQGIASITPYFARVDAVTRFPWSAAYLTRERAPETVYKLLLNNPDLMDPVKPKPGAKPRVPVKVRPVARIDPKEKNKPVEKIDPAEQARRDEKTRVGMIAARRMRICDFFAQAGWFDIADRELDRLLKDLPDEKERVERARLMIDKLRARDLWEQTKTLYQAGRYDAVRARLAKFPVKKVPDRIQADMREMKERMAGSAALMEEAAAALQACSTEVTTPNGRSLASVVPIIRSELHPTTVGRLDAFLGQVRDAARQKTRGQKATQTPEALLSLAVTGWLLGSPSAEAMPLTAVNLWKSRQMVLAYLQETDRKERDKILAAYQRDVSPSVDIDEIAQLIDHLPPADPVQVPAGVTVERKVGKGRLPTTYYLRLPPEYSHTRQYPVVILLTNNGERPKEVIERWAAAAADNGYILVAPEWDRGINSGYGFTEQEHHTVTDTLRDLRRRFQIDSDRVFLHGVGEGALMAFDVGLAHPDLFAGVLPMGGGPVKYAKRYWRNAQYLPFYVVNGTRAGDTNKVLREQFEYWVLRGFPSLWIEYKGRGIEWFGGELPNMFDWMRISAARSHGVSSAPTASAAASATSSARCGRRTTISTG